jgi:hypothetical protein
MACTPAGVPSSPNPARSVSAHDLAAAKATKSDRITNNIKSAA